MEVFSELWEEFKKLDIIIHLIVFLILAATFFAAGVDYGEKKERAKQFKEMQQKIMIMDAVKEAMRE